jgi:hypothetical protein
MRFCKSQLVGFRLGAIHDGINLRWEGEPQKLVKEALEGDKDAFLPGNTEPGIQCQLELNGLQILDAFVLELGEDLQQLCYLPLQRTFSSELVVKLPAVAYRRGSLRKLRAGGVHWVTVEVRVLRVKRGECLNV